MTNYLDLSFGIFMVQYPVCVYFAGQMIFHAKGVSTPGPTRACALVNLTCALVNS